MLSCSKYQEDEIGGNMNLGFLALWILIASWFLAAIISFIVCEVKEHKKNKKERKDGKR